MQHDISLPSAGIESLSPSASMARSEDEDDSNPKKRKRNRVALSCTECKRRKIKCDRKSPCTSCLKRQEGSRCHWEDPTIAVEAQPFALVEDLEGLRSRVETLEQLLRQSTAHAAPQPSFAPTSVNPASLHSLPGPSMRSSKPSEPISNGRATRPRNNTSATEISADDLDDEDAAKVLEEIAMGKGIQEPGSRRMSVASRPTAQHYRIPNGNLTSVFCEEALLEDDMARLARQQEIFPIHSALAISQGVCDELLSIYFRRMDWSWKVHHEPTFLAEYQEYRSLQASGQYNLIDPAWLALYSMTLCVAASSLSRDLPMPVRQAMTEEEIKALPEKLFSASRAAMRLAKWDSKPQIRSCSTILLFGAFSNHFSGPELNTTHFAIWLSAALRIAQLKGLHRLGDDPHKMPDDDPAWPSGSNCLKRELGKRLWIRLVLLDWQSSLRTNLSSIHPDDFDTSLPLNLNDEDLDGTTVEVKPRPPQEITDVTYEVARFELSRHQREVSSLQRAHSINYDQILTADSELRAIFARLTDDLGNTSASNSHRPADEWRRNTIHRAFHNRILRLHRPFFSRGLKDKRSAFFFSTTSCIESAKVIISTLEPLRNTPILGYWSSYVETLGAAIVLWMSIHLLEESDSNADLQRKSDYLRKALTHLRLGEEAFNESVRQVASQARRVVESLLAALAEKRQSRQHATAESIKSVLQRVADGVSSESSAPTLSLTRSAPASTNASSMYAIPLPMQPSQSPTFTMSNFTEPSTGISPPSFVSDLETRATDALWSGFKGSDSFAGLEANQADQGWENLLFGLEGLDTTKTNWMT